MAIGEAGTNTVAPEHPFVKLMYEEFLKLPLA